MRGLRILMYHVIGERDEPAARFVVPIGAFERQMAWLARLRFNVISLREAVKRLLAGELLPRLTVALTFDDGTRDLRTLAYPVLARHDFPATAFVVTGAMGGAVDWTRRPGIAGRATLSWDEALELEPLVSLQPHTRTHPSLPKLADRQLGLEIQSSREELQKRTGRSQDIFAYPYGHYDRRVVDAVRDAGYSAACSVRIGMNHALTPRYELRRYEIRGDRPFKRFERALAHAA